MLPQHGERIEIGRSAIDRVRLNPAIDSADVAQLVEHHLAKVRVAGSNPVIRSEAPPQWWRGREARQRPAKPYTRVRIPSPPPLHRAIGAVVARFLDTEEVAGSNPVSPTKRAPSIARGPLLCVEHVRKLAQTSYAVRHMIGYPMGYESANEGRLDQRAAHD